MHLIKTIFLLILLVFYSALAQADEKQGADTQKHKPSEKTKAPRPTIKILLIDTMDTDAGLDRTAESFDLLVDQLKQIEHLKINTTKDMSLIQNTVPEAIKESLGKAQSLIRKGKESLLNISLEDAADAFQSARVLYRKNMAWLNDPEPLIMALMGLAEALSTKGDKEGARFSYKEVLSLNPDFEPDPGQVPTKLRSLFEDVRQEVSQELGGQISIQIQPEGARVIFDGLTIGNCPLLKDDVSPGLHFIKITKDGFRPLRKVLDVQGGQTAKVKGKLKPLLGLEITRRLRTSLRKDSLETSLELAKDLSRVGGYNAVICSQLAKPSGSISPVFSAVVIPSSGRPSKLAARLPEKNAKRVMEAVALQISDTLDEGSSPMAVPNDLGLDFEHSLLGTPKPLSAPTLVSIPPGLDTRPTKEIFPGSGDRKPGKVGREENKSIWTRWWLWTGVGVLVAGGIAGTLALTLDRDQKTINDPDRILIRMDTSRER